MWNDDVSAVGNSLEGFKVLRSSGQLPGKVLVGGHTRQLLDGLDTLQDTLVESDQLAQLGGLTAVGLILALLVRGRLLLGLLARGGLVVFDGARHVKRYQNQ